MKAHWNRLSVVTRLASLILLAQKRGPLPTVEQLAQTHGVHPRTIKRDLKAIEAAGLTVWRAERYGAAA